MSTPAGQKTKIQAMYRNVAITADSNGNLPTRVELLSTGQWPASSNKGPLEENVGSLGEYKRNFDSGIAQSKDAEGNWLGIPVDFMHESWDQAGAWIKAMEVAPSSNPDLPADEGGMSLWASSVEYTAAGSQAILGGMFKCFSPSWWPASRGDWTDPEDPNIVARNVIDGGGFTNIPFFKKLQSLTASNAPVGDSSKNDNNVIYIKATKENQNMTLDEVRVKEVSALNDEEKKLLKDNEAELSAEEKVKLADVLTPAADPVPEPAPAPAADPANTNINPEATPVTDPEVEAVTASLKSGELVAVKADVFNGMQKTLSELQRDKVEASVKTHLARGAIKADQAKDWTDRIVKDPTLASVLENLPSNVAMAETIGSSTQEKAIENAEEEVHNMVVAARSEEKNKGKMYSQVRASILADPKNKELATAINGGKE